MSSAAAPEVAFSASRALDVDRLARVGRRRVHPAGALVTRRDTQPTAVHVVLSGSVELSRRVGERAGVVTIVRAGEAFDDGPLLAGRPVRYDARTLERTELLCVPADVFLQLARHRHRHRRRHVGRWGRDVSGRSSSREARLLEALVRDPDVHRVRPSTTREARTRRQVDPPQGQEPCSLG
jgi:CRP-like cAMP-binding protein